MLRRWATSRQRRPRSGCSRHRRRRDAGDAGARAPRAVRGCGSAASSAAIDAADAGLYRDALGIVPPGGLPDAFLADVPDALVRLLAPLRAHARARSPTTQLQSALRPRRRGSRCASWSAAARSCAASCCPGGTTGEREWCDGDVLRRLRRASLAALRKEIEPAEQRALRGLPAGLAGGRPPRRGPAGEAARSSACARRSFRCRAWR